MNRNVIVLQYLSTQFSNERFLAKFSVMDSGFRVFKVEENGNNFVEIFANHFYSEIQSYNKKKTLSTPFYTEFKMCIEFGVEAIFFLLF